MQDSLFPELTPATTEGRDEASAPWPATRAPRAPKAAVGWPDLTPEEQSRLTLEQVRRFYDRRYGR